MASKCVFSSILKMDWNIVSVLIVINLSLVAVGFGWGFCFLFHPALPVCSVSGMLPPFYNTWE